MTRTSLSLALAALVALSGAGAARAAEYLITGTELAGRATVTDLGPGKVHVTATVRGFGKNKPGSIAGDGSKYAAGLSIRSGGKTYWLQQGANGQLTVSVGGATQTWLPAKSTKGLVVLAVPGLSTNAWNRIGIPYLDENVAALTAFGYAARRVDIKTEASVATNAAYIQGQIRAEAAKGNRVILFAHSKGAVDTTAALALDPSLVPSVVGVIAVQPVWIGSPMAEMIASSHLLEASVKLLFEKVLKGQMDAVLDLDFAKRKAFMATHPYPVAQIPTVVVRSSFSRGVSKSPLWANQKYITSKYKKPNDGMVLFDDQAIPGAVATIDLANMDHFEPGLRNESPNTPLIVTTRSLTALLAHLK